jgi:hypothetical protein
MGKRLFVVSCLIAALLTGCGKELPPPQPLGPPTPLSLAEWKKLPVELKYDEATFERLKLADPKLKSPEAWHEFMVKVVVPERKIDIPGIPGQK